MTFEVRFGADPQWSRWLGGEQGGEGVTPFWKAVRELAAMRKFIPRERRAMSAVREAFQFEAPQEVVFTREAVDALHEALRSLVDVLDRQGGYMTSEDQAALWRARALVRGRP